MTKHTKPGKSSIWPQISRDASADGPAFPITERFNPGLESLQTDTGGRSAGRWRRFTQPHWSTQVLAYSESSGEATGFFWRVHGLRTWATPVCRLLGFRSSLVRLPLFVVHTQWPVTGLPKTDATGTGASGASHLPAAPLVGRHDDGDAEVIFFGAMNNRRVASL
jgi:hypothetical protein